MMDLFEIGDDNSHAPKDNKYRNRNMFQHFEKKKKKKSPT